MVTHEYIKNIEYDFSRANILYYFFREKGHTDCHSINKLECCGLAPANSKVILQHTEGVTGKIQLFIRCNFPNLLCRLETPHFGHISDVPFLDPGKVLATF